MTISLWALVAIYLLVGVSVALLLDAWEDVGSRRRRVLMALFWVVLWFPAVVAGAVVVALVVVVAGIINRL